MNAKRFDAFTRHTLGAVSPRRSLLALAAAAGTSAAFGPLPAAADKDKKKIRKRAKKRAEKKCKRQGEQCRNVFLELCEGPTVECPEEDLNGIFACCDLLKECKAGEAVECLVVDLLS